ncbi:DNA-binding response regulator [Enterococcus termitis]
MEHLDSLHGVLIYSSEDSQSQVLELILSLKKQSLLPIWVKSKTENEISKKINLELGVLGNLDKNISDDELFVIIENTLKLIHKSDRENINGRNTSNELELNSLNCSMKLPNKSEVSLTRLEYRMVSLLASRVNQAFTYEEISNHVWEGNENVDFSMKTYRVANVAFHIRNKLKQGGVDPKILRTVRSVGYLLDSSREAIF